MADYGIRTSLPGKSVFDTGGTNLNFATDRAFIKIDTQNNKGFQTITLIVTNDPPEPSGGNIFAYTVLYSFNHGYKYVPSLESLFYITTPPPSTSFYQKYFQDFGICGAYTAFDEAALWAVADATKVYIVCGKYKDTFGGASSNLLTGMNVQITTHVFVEDIGL